MSLNFFEQAVRGTIPDCLVFDVDGVLIDTGESFPEVIRRTVEQEWGRVGFTVDKRGYSAEHNTVLKQNRAFNDDFDIAWMLLNLSASRGTVLSEALPTPEELAEIIASCGDNSVKWARANFKEVFERDHIRALCSDIYVGSGGDDGIYLIEKPQLRTGWRELPLPGYIYTGRDEKEWRLAQKLLDWGDLPDERVVHSGTGMVKPSPDGLIHICSQFGHKSPVFFGDTVSDLQAFRTFGRGWFAAIGHIIEDAEHRFSDVNEALSKLAELME